MIRSSECLLLAKIPVGESKIDIVHRWKGKEIPMVYKRILNTGEIYLRGKQVCRIISIEMQYLIEIYTDIANKNHTISRNIREGNYVYEGGFLQGEHEQVMLDKLLDFIIGESLLFEYYIEQL
jgi:hypothetical protein